MKRYKSGVFFFYFRGIQAIDGKWRFTRSHGTNKTEGSTNEWCTKLIREVLGEHFDKVPETNLDALQGARPLLDVTANSLSAGVVRHSEALMHLLLLLLRSKYGYFMRRLERLCMHAREGKKLGRGPRQVASAHNPVITQQARSCLLLYCTVAFLYCTVRATRFKISKSVAYVPVFPFRYARVRVERERECSTGQ